MKPIIIFLTILASVFQVQAQGEIFFNNLNNTLISTNSTQGGMATGPTAAGNALYYYALFYSQISSTVGGNSSPIMGAHYSGNDYAFDDPNWTFVAMGTNSTSGRFLSEVQNTNGTTTVNGVPANSNAYFVVVGWSASMGSTLMALKYYYDNAEYNENDWIGQSAVSGLITLSDGVSFPPPALFAASYPQIPGFILGETPVFLPEPSMIALFATGVVSLFLYRRKKIP